MNRSLALLLVLAGAAFGGTVMWWTLGRAQEVDPTVALALSSAEPSSKSEQAPAHSALPAVSVVERRAPVEIEPPETSRLALEEAPLFGEALLQLAQKQLLLGWSRERNDQPMDKEVNEGLELFREQTPALATTIGRELAKR